MISKLLFLLENILGAVVRLPWALLTYVRDWLHFRKLANRFPGPPGLPLVGNLFDCGLAPNPWNKLKWTMEYVMTRYPAGQIRFWPYRFITLSDVNDLQTFLTNSKNQSKPKMFVDGLYYSLGKGLVTINGDEWSRHHKLMLPYFHQNLLKTYVSVFDRKGDVFIENLAKCAHGRAFDIKLMTETVEADIIYENIFGVPSSQQTDTDVHMFELVFQGQKELFHRMNRPWLFADAIYNISPAGYRAKSIRKQGHRYVEKVVEKRIEILRAKAESLSRNGRFQKQQNTPDSAIVAPSRNEDVESNTKKSCAMIDALIQENGRSISYESVKDEMVTFFLAGFDTTAITLQFALYFLAKNPLVQEKAVRELRNIFDAAGSSEVTWDTLQRMQYVEMIVKETLRLHPPVFFFMREAGVDTPLKSCDLVVPAGATVIMSPRNMHMNSKLYPDPHVFDPERFSPENSAGRHPFAFIPFAAGSRSCIGKKYSMLVLKSVISKVIWNFHILPDESYKPKFLWGVTMVVSNGMWIKLLKRSTCPE